MPIARVDGIDINYEVHGEGYPLVLAHGYTASLRMWDDQIATFATAYRVAVYDSRGHGDTKAPKDLERYSLSRDYVGDQLALMDHLGIERAHVGGLSMGGMIAQEFALQHPDRVKGLLLLDTGPGVGSVRRDTAIAARFGQFRSMMQGLARTNGMGAIVQVMRNSPIAFRPAGDAPLPAGVRRHGEGMLKMDVDGYLGGARAIQDWAGSADRLQELRMPALVLVGEQDQLLPASRIIHGKIAGSRFALLRNCGHGSSVWRPAAAARVIMDFLADVDAGRHVAGEITVE